MAAESQESKDENCQDSQQLGLKLVGHRSTIVYGRGNGSHLLWKDDLRIHRKAFMVAILGDATTLRNKGNFI